jgi:mannose-6-phosphate isomerase-like protein (cupin superfamily)
MTMRTRYAEIPAYQTRDGSQIRELMHPDRHGNRMQSLAEAVVLPGQETLLHQHLRTEELYHITAGHGLMTLGDDRFEVGVGDTVLIPPGTAHCIRNLGSEPLRILCSCSPAYSHEDTQILTGEDGTAIG